MMAPPLMRAAAAPNHQRSCACCGHDILGKRFFSIQRDSYDLCEACFTVNRGGCVERLQPFVCTDVRLTDLLVSSQPYGGACARCRVPFAKSHSDRFVSLSRRHGARGVRSLLTRKGKPLLECDICGACVPKAKQWAAPFLKIALDQTAAEGEDGAVARGRDDKAAINRLTHMSPGGVAFAAIIALPGSSVASNPGVVADEVHRQLVNSTWLGWASKHPDEAMQNVDAFISHMTMVGDVIPFVMPLIATIRAWKAGGTPDEVVHAGAIAFLHGVVGQLLVSLIVTPFIGACTAAVVAPAAVAISLEATDGDACCDDCLDALNCWQ